MLLVLASMKPALALVAALLAELDGDRGDEHDERERDADQDDDLDHR